MERTLIELISKFGLTNEYTENLSIWVGHAAIGGKGQPTMEEAKQILSRLMGDCVADKGQETPEWISKTLEQWQNFHPYQHVRERDQPLYVKKLDNGKVIVAVIWPWQIKKNIASIMVYEGDLLE